MGVSSWTWVDDLELAFDHQSWVFDENQSGRCDHNVGGEIWADSGKPRELRSSQNKPAVKLVQVLFCVAMVQWFKIIGKKTQNKTEQECFNSE